MDALALDMNRLGLGRTDLTPEVIAMGVSRAFRIRRVGLVYFVENVNLSRRLNEVGKEIVEENWKVVAVAKRTPGGKSPRVEAFEWMYEAQREALAPPEPWKLLVA